MTKPRKRPTTKNEFLQICMDAMELTIKGTTLKIQHHLDHDGMLQKTYKNLDFLPEIADLLVAEFGFLRFKLGDATLLMNPKRFSKFVKSRKYSRNWEYRIVYDAGFGQSIKNEIVFNMLLLKFPGRLEVDDQYVENISEFCFPPIIV